MLLYVDLVVLVFALGTCALEGYAFRKALAEQRVFMVDLVRELSLDVDVDPEP